MNETTNPGPDLSKKLNEEIQILLNFVNAPLIGLQGSFYASLFEQLNILEQKEGTLFAHGKNLGEKLGNPESSIQAIENYFEALNQFFLLHSELVQEEVRKIKEHAEQLERDLEECNKRVNSDDPNSDIAVAKKKIIELKKQLEATIPNDYQYELERNFLDQMQQHQKELFKIRGQLSEIAEENIITIVRKDLTSEIKIFLNDKNLAWNEKIQKIKEELQASNTLIENIKANNTNVTQVYQQMIDSHSEFQRKIKENYQSLVTLTKDYQKRISSRAQIVTLLFFFLLVIAGEFSITYTISIHALRFITNNSIAYWFFVIGYPIAIGMSVKLWIQTSENPIKIKGLLAKALIVSCLIGLLGLAYLNSNYQASINNKENTVNIESINNTNTPPTSLLEKVFSTSYATITVFFCFSTLFGGTAGLLFVVFFDKYEDYVNVKKSFLRTYPSKKYKGNFERVITTEISELESFIKDLLEKRDTIKSQLTRIEVYKNVPLTKKITYTDWVAKLKLSARSNFMAGYEAGKSERINSRDESDIILTDIKTRGVNKIINSYKTVSNGQPA